MGKFINEFKEFAVKGNAVDGFHFACRGEKRGVQIINFKQCHIYKLLSQFLSFGSKASRRPSPKRFRESTTREMVTAGITSR